MYQALKGGVKLGRLQTVRKAKSNPHYKLVNNEKMAAVARRWKACSSSVELACPLGRKKRNLRPYGCTKVNGITHAISKLKKSPDILVVDESLPVETKSISIKKSNIVSRLKPPIDITWKQESQNFIPLSNSFSEDEYNTGLSCPQCWLSFWYETQLSVHANIVHDVKSLNTCLSPVELV